MKKNIKLVSIFAASALTLAFSGCSNDSQEQNALFRYNELNAKASLLSDNRYSGIMQDFGTNTYYPVGKFLLISSNNSLLLIKSFILHHSLSMIKSFIHLLSFSRGL